MSEYAKERKKGAHETCARQKGKQVQRPWGRNVPGCLTINKEGSEGAGEKQAGDHVGDNYNDPVQS